MPTNIAIVAIPSLGEDGWLFSGMRQADYLMAHFLASEYSQSYVHFGEISSFGYLVQEFNNRPNELLTEAPKVLTRLFERYFNNIVCEAWDSTDPKSPSRFILSIFVQFDDANGKTGNISQLVQINGSKFETLRRIINDGAI